MCIYLCPCVHVCMCPYVQVTAGALGGQMRTSDLLEMESQAVVSSSALWPWKLNLDPRREQ